MNRLKAGEKRLDRSARLTLAVLALVFLYTVIDLAYRFTLPTAGWEVSEAVDIGMVYLRNLSGSPSPLQTGDHVIAVNGISSDWREIQKSDALRTVWQFGAVIDFTVVRDGQEIHVPVSLKQWDWRALARAQFTDPVTMAGLLSNWTLFILALVVFLRRPDSLSAGPFLLVIAIFAGGSLSDLLPAGFSTTIDPFAGLLRLIVSNILLTALFSYAFIRFAMVFPKPSALYQRFPWLPFAAGTIGFLLVILFPAQAFSWFWFVLSLLIGVGLMIRNAFTMRDPVSRAQIRWGVGGIMAGLGTLTVMVVINTSGMFTISENTFAIASAVGTTLMGVMLAVGISRYRLFDIDVIIRRTLQYAVLTGVLALVYFGGVVLLQEIFGRLTGEQGSPLVTVISTLGIAALFSPLRSRTQDWIDRRFFRSKYDAESALLRFALDARDEVDLNLLANAILQVAESTLQPDRATLHLRVGPHDRLDTDIS